MIRRILTVLGAIIAGVAVAAVAAFLVILIGVRTGNRPFIRRFTRLQRDVLNKGAMQKAGQPGAPAAVVEHVGRKSGTPYETPVTVFREGDEWVIALPYGDQTSWARNVVAAGEAHIRIDGERHRVAEIEIVPVESTLLATKSDAAIRLFGVRHAVRMTRMAESPEALEVVPEPTP